MNRVPASARLRRMLSILPWLMSQPDGASIDDLCRRFDLTREQLLADLDIVWMVGVYPYSPDTLVEVMVDVALARVPSLSWLNILVDIAAIAGLASVVLVMLMGQPRIFFSMARDGLLPAWAATLHPRTRIPAATTLLTGVVVALAAAVGDAAETYDLTNIGTLFAFVVVCAAVLRSAG